VPASRIARGNRSRSSAPPSGERLKASLPPWLRSADSIRPDASFALEQVGSDVYLTFVAVPEPSMIVLVSIGLVGRLKRGLLAAFVVVESITLEG